MHDTLKRIIEEGKTDLENIAKLIESRRESAQKVIERCKRDMAGVTQFAEDLPQKVLEKFSVVMTAEFDFHNQGLGYGQLQFEGQSQTLHGLFGRREAITGKYRAIVILEKID